MTLYKCFTCKREIKSDLTRKKVRCVYCGSKILYKPRTVTSTVKAI